MMGSPNWLNRYRQGQRGRVWLELRQFGARVREPELMEEAQLVCDEMGCTSGKQRCRSRTT